MRERLEHRVLQSSEELTALAPAWERLWRTDADATPFQHPAWLLPWWRQFGHGDLRTVAMYREGELVGLLPFYIYARADGRDGSERHLLPIGMGTTDYLDGLFAPKCTSEEICEGLRTLRAAGGWDVAYVNQLRGSSRLLGALQGGKMATRSISSDNCWRMPAARIPDLPQKIRRGAMYYRNRANRAGNLELAWADASNVLEWFDTFERLQHERWQASGKRGVLADERVVQWHRVALPGLAIAGLLRMYALRLNGEAIAMLYALFDPPERCQRSLYVYLPAFSMRRAHLRPGTLMLAFAGEQAADEGVQTIDLLRGNEPYKQMWHAEAVATHGFEFAPLRQRSPSELAAA